MAGSNFEKFSFLLGDVKIQLSEYSGVFFQNGSDRQSVYFTSLMTFMSLQVLLQSKVKVEITAVHKNIPIEDMQHPSMF